MAAVRIATEPCGSLLKIRIRIENVTPCAAATLDQREEAVRQSMASTHAILAIEGGAFVSLIDPPEVMSALAGTWVDSKTFPVLAGGAGSRAGTVPLPAAGGRERLADGRLGRLGCVCVHPATHFRRCSDAARPAGGPETQHPASSE